MGSLIESGAPVLLVASDADLRSKLRQQLVKYRREFPQLMEAESATDAMAILRDHSPMACVIDFHMQGQSGLTFLRRLRGDYAEDLLPVVMLTDGLDADTAVDLLRSGAQDCLSTPELSAERLYSALSGALRTTKMQRQLNHLAHTDALTGLINRSLLMNRLELALKRCDRYNERCALLYLNLDGFKPINDMHGHSVGDKLLQIVAERIKANCRNTDSPARLSGDEFVVLLENINDNTGHKVATKLLSEVAKPMDIDGRIINVRCSIGLACYPDTARDAEELLQQADRALYRAKASAITDFVAFSQSHKSEWQRQHLLESELPNAIATGQLALAYQPIVDAQTFEMKRLEVLTRWPRDDFHVNPMDLMEMIDRLNLFDAFHAWLFDTAFSQMKAWQSETHCPSLCLNIPANYCYNFAIADAVKASMERHGIDPTSVELEITESTLMRYPERTIAVLTALHELGLRIAIDDFGTGYSSMSYLTQLPLDTLKIDRNFFLKESNRERNRKVIEAITALGHSLDLEVIAEGVETEVQLQLARDVGCDLLQGYYFGRPAFPGKNWVEYVGQFCHIDGAPKDS